jgi:hypothetical protein
MNEKQSNFPPYLTHIVLEGNGKKGERGVRHNGDEKGVRNWRISACGKLHE